MLFLVFFCFFQLQTNDRSNERHHHMIRQEWFVLATSSEEQEDTLRLSDLATICLGYMVMSLMVFMWRGIINAISDRTNTQILLRAKKAMRVIAAVVKVGWSLGLAWLF